MANVANLLNCKEGGLWVIYILIDVIVCFRRTISNKGMLHLSMYALSTLSYPQHRIVSTPELSHCESVSGHAWSNFERIDHYQELPFVVGNL